ncbi:MAG: CARDB domain-containing protein [Bradymonadaceae bacterium]
MTHFRPPIRLRSWLLSFSAALLLAASCGGSSSNKSAQVEITGVSPSPSYPGVETTVDFELKPGAGTSGSDLSWKVDFGDGTSKRGDGTSASVSHTYQASGQFAVEVTARAGGSAVGSASRTHRVRPPVDLAVTNVSARPGNVSPGDSVTVGFDLENKTPTPMESEFDAALLLSQDASVSADELADLQSLGSETVAAQEGVVVGAGETRSVGLTTKVPEDVEGGDYHVVAWAKPKGQFADADGSNNFAASNRISVDTKGSDLPDVAVRDVVVSPTRAFPSLNQFTRSFVLQNGGEAEAFEVKTRTYLSVGDDTLDDDDRKVAELKGTKDIPPGESVEIGPDELTLDSDIKPPNTGEKKVYVLVEAFMTDDQAQDADESNNIGMPESPIVVTDDLADGPDLVVKSFSVSPENTFLGGSLEVSMTVANQGKKDIDSFVCRMYLGREANFDRERDRSFDNVSISSLKSDASRDIQRTLRIPEFYNPGTYHVYTVCDPTGAIPNESYRSNNRKMHPNPVEVTNRANVDLFVNKLQAPDTADEGKSFTVTAEICVNGANPSGATKGKLFQAPGASPKNLYKKDNRLKTFDIPNINPNQCKNVDLDVKPDCQDFEELYTLGAKVDVEDSLPEKDEKNNQTSTSTPLEYTGRFCKCTEDNFEPNNLSRRAAPLQPGKTSAAICKPGSVDYYAVDLKKGESLVVENTFEPSKGSLTTALFPPPPGGGNTKIDSDATPGRQRVGAFVVDKAGTYVVRISAEGQSRNLYDLEMRVLSQTAKPDVLPTDVELPSRQSFSIGAKIPLTFRVHNLGEAKSGAVDAELVVSPDQTLGDGNDVSFTPATYQVGRVPPGGKFDAKVTVEIPSSLSKGTYFAGVRLDPNSQITDARRGNNTAFSRQVTVETRCFDSLEPNDSFDRARKISGGSFANLSACASSDDFYKICVPGGKKFSVKTEFKSRGGKNDIDLELFDRRQKIIDSSASATKDVEEVSVDFVNGNQCYFARVFMLTVQKKLETSYDLSVDVQDVPPSLQCDSKLEPNDTFQASADLLGAVQNSPKIDRCPTGDTDYYGVRLNRGQTVTFRGILDPANQPGTLRIQLYNPSQTPVANKETAPGIPKAEIKDFTAPTTGRYYLQVTVSGNKRRTTYRLEADGLGGVDLQADNLDVWPGTHRAGDPLQLDYKLRNLRSDDAKKADYDVYLGKSKSLKRNRDIKLGTFSHAKVPGNSTIQVFDRTTLPDKQKLENFFAGNFGTAHVHVDVRVHSSQSDTNPSNNVASTPLKLKP